LANLFLQAGGMTVDNNSSILATGLGHCSNEGQGAGTSGAGGSYGGLGGGSGLGQTYGNEQQPTDFGSGGGGRPEAPGLCSSRPGGAGGGAVILDVENNLEINGLISANGQDGLSSGSYGCASTGGGSGGSVYIIAETLIGSGIVFANGGNAFAVSGAGGGGRAAIYGNVDNFTGQIKASAGRNSYNVNYNGQDGTVYLSP
jgi:hypothetical protein